MPVEISGQRYYRTSEICLKASISRATLFRWIKSGIVKNQLRDRRGWRLFTEEDVQKLQAEVGKIESEDDELRNWK
ncbi:MAG TPA: MerR family transcriptional regulator [Dehalococcoidia bacterium]|nr:MerR family transcriptional regulator [Dehalococcoidia bacterium]